MRPRWARPARRYASRASGGRCFGCSGSCKGCRVRRCLSRNSARPCTYLLNHWDVLVAHQDHAGTRLDNNLLENAIRPTALGRKNWLFIGHPAAIIYSLVVSCQLRGKDPLAYLSVALTPGNTTSLLSLIEDRRVF